MVHYLKFGATAAWPYLSVIRDMVRLERSLDKGLESLKTQAQALRWDSNLTDVMDDVDSLTSTDGIGDLAVQSPCRVIHNLRTKLGMVEQENKELRRQLADLQLMNQKRTNQRE